MQQTQRTGQRDPQRHVKTVAGETQDPIDHLRSDISRRRIIRVTTALVAAQAGLAGITPAVAQGGRSNAGHNDAGKDAVQNGTMPDVTPPEDLMREHGVLNRVC